MEATDVPNKSYVRLGYVNARLRRRRSISRTPRTPVSTNCTTTTNTRAPTIHCVLAPTGNSTEHSMASDILLNDHRTRVAGKENNWRSKARARIIIWQKSNRYPISRWSARRARIETRKKKRRGQRGTTRVATAPVSTHTRIHRKEKVPREGDTAPSPMRGSSATERVEASSSSRKPQAASADRRRRTNQGCPLRNYPTPKN
ncbi:uncharacterized protein LOC122569047 [Bombus pyrosoma]|uniref:uncharacterized protein LOC122569047 n=1 Tax=Bombus pyrosoma TaxID=396416 RepID=UPI001CB995CD|nr:uncharacterized protein LOC122569047 [Bombus pyrosoma]